MQSPRLEQKKNICVAVISLFTLLLLSANFVGDHSLQLFYFTFSTGTLLMQLVYCGIILFSEICGYKKTALLILMTGLLNLIVAFSSFYSLGLPIPEFWTKAQVDGIDIAQQLIVILMLTVSYLCCALSMLTIAELLKIWLGHSWLLLRVTLLMMIAGLVDMLVLTPVLVYISPDSYMALWKVLSFLTVKIYLSLFAIPLCYLVLLVYRMRRDPQQFIFY